MPQGERIRNIDGWRSPDVWSKTETFDGNVVRQLLVPSSTFIQISGEIGALRLENSYGSWPALTPIEPISNTGLFARLPLGAAPGGSAIGARWTAGPHTQMSPSAILDTYRGALKFDEAFENLPGLRTPQLGAVHAVLGHWTTGRKEAGIVVMPTGTGKTETMLALLIAARPQKLLVLVPSDQLRDQVSSKFERLGILQEFGIVHPFAERPVVGKILHGFRSVNSARDFANLCNVIITTPNALLASIPEAFEEIASQCSHIFVDEAHHVAAKTWSAILGKFREKHIIQFTATPYREDGRYLLGRTIYAFSLREAQRQGYFSTIDYTAVIDLDNDDKELARQAVDRLRADLAAGHDHLLMVRVGSIRRAQEVKPHYDAIAGDFKPVIVNSGMAKRDQKQSLKDLADRSSRIIICISMLGEGFDLPALKIAAVHDPQKSLGVTLQFVGRFARTSTEGTIGSASVFVVRKELDFDRRLRTLYAEDADWDVILRILSDTAVESQREVSDFETGFVSPSQVALRNLLPKMSAVVYRTITDNWVPEKLVEYFGEDQLLTIPIGLNATAGVAWCVVENRQSVRWGDLRTIEEVTFDLYILYFDAARRLLYVNNSANDGYFEELVEAVAGPHATRFTGPTVYRVMADIQRLIPTNVGVLDIHNHFRRFSMHVGSDVTASFTQAEAGTKSQTNISGGGYRDGEHVNISASLKGRIWSFRTAHSLKNWCDWCDSIGTKLLDDTISIESVIGQFILPKELMERPDSVLLGMEWPWEVHEMSADNLVLELQNNSQPLAYCDLVPANADKNGPFKFNVVSDFWSIPYEADFVDGQLTYRCLGDIDITTRTARTEISLTAWLNRNNPNLILDGDRLIHGNLLYEADHARPPYSRDKLQILDWTGVDIHSESQGAGRISTSIQFRIINDMKLETNPPWDLILDDDGTGEIADIVALRIEDDALLVRLVHCKFSTSSEPGARLGDLYEVCGQAQKSVAWRRNDMMTFFKTLGDRARKKSARTGVSPFEVGTIGDLLKIQEKSLVMARKMEIVIVQPGLSASAAQSPHLELLASTESYLQTTINAPLYVMCSG